MTIKRTRPDRSKAMKGKPGLNPNGRPAPDISVTIHWQLGYGELTYGNEKIQGDAALILKCEKMLMRGRKK